MADLQFIVFNNITKFAEYRNFTILNTFDSHMLSKAGKDAVFKFNNQDLIMFECVNKTDASKILIVLMAPLNDGVSTSSKSNSAAYAINKFDIDLVLLISFNKLSSIQLRKMIEDHKTCKNIYNYDYKDLALVKPEAEIVSEYRILTKKEKDDLCESKKILIGDLPLMYFTDPLNVWIGANVGDVIAFIRNTDGFGISEYYRYIIN